MKMNLCFILLLFTTIVTKNLVAQDASFETYLNIFRLDSLPFNTVKIRDDKEFMRNKEKYRINKDNCLKYIVKDTSDLGFKYISEGMDNDRKEERYFQNKFYAYCKFSLKSNLYFVILKKEDMYSSDYYLVIYNKQGENLSNFQLTGEEMDNYFFRSELKQDFSIKKVFYRFVESKKSLIEEEFYELDTKSFSYKFKSSIKKNTFHFYYEYINHKLEDDPLL